MKAEPLFREKRILTHKSTGDVAIAELKIWRVPKSADYPSQIKFSLFLVCNGRVLVGLDNHKPKGPHLHLGAEEVPYAFCDAQTLLKDFWDLVRTAGYD
jgi:hypothetical protein